MDEDWRVEDSEQNSGTEEQGEKQPAESQVAEYAGECEADSGGAAVGQKMLMAARVREFGSAETAAELANEAEADSAAE